MKFYLNYSLSRVSQDRMGHQQLTNALCFLWTYYFTLKLTPSHSFSISMDDIILHLSKYTINWVTWLYVFAVVMGPPEALPFTCLVQNLLVPSKSNTPCGFTVFVLAASFLGYPTQFTKLIFLELPPNLSATYSKALGFSITYKIIISLSSKEVYNNKSHFYLSSFISHYTELISYIPAKVFYLIFWTCTTVSHPEAITLG